ncbi:MAG: Ig-like domain repeat protein [Nitrososphaerota archaeon]|nr:Ig-like domain repeat protein [Nitrososphaerota archaeon]
MVSLSWGSTVSKKGTSAALSALFVFSIAAIALTTLSAPVAASTGSSLVQHANNGCNSCSNTVSVQLPNSVALGDVLVVGVSTLGSSGIVSVNSVTDSLGSPFTQVGSSSLGSTYQYSSIYYSPAYSSGPDTVTVTFSASGMDADVYVFEVAGVSAAPPTFASGSDPYGSYSTSTSTSVAFTPGAFLVAVINPEGAGITPGAGFSFVNGYSGFYGAYSGTEYATSGVPSPTDFPSSLSGGFTWVESAAAFTPVPVTTVTETVTEVSTVTSTQTATSVSTTTETATTTLTQTTTQTATETSTVTTTETSTVQAPTQVSVTCAPADVKVGHSALCTATVTSADGGRLTGSVSFVGSQGGTFGAVSCTTHYAGGASGQELVCMVAFTPASAGAQSVTATYSGDAYHSAGSGAFGLAVS